MKKSQKQKNPAVIGFSSSLIFNFDGVLEQQKQNMIDAIAKTVYQDIFQQKLLEIEQDSVKVTFKVAFSFSEDDGAYYSFDVESNRKGVRPV